MATSGEEYEEAVRKNSEPVVVSDKQEPEPSQELLSNDIRSDNDSSSRSLDSDNSQTKYKKKKKKKKAGRAGVTCTMVEEKEDVPAAMN